MGSLMRCADCKYFEAAERADRWPGSGHCTRWTQGYGWDAALMKPNDAWVECDEGWGNFVGPDFGCVLFEARMAFEKD